MELCSQDEAIVIVGGGFCGLATALALHRKGIRSLVLESSFVLRSAGAGIAVYTNGWRALDQLGVGEELRRKSVAIKGIRKISLDTGVQRVIPFRDEELRCLKRSDVVETLASRLPPKSIRFGCRVVSIESNADASAHELHLKDGSLIRTRVLIGCDGVNSTVADHLGLKPLKCFSTSRTRGYTNYPNGHGFSREFVRTRRENVLVGRIPIDDNLVYWFLIRPWLPTDAATRTDPKSIQEAARKATSSFPAETIEMVHNADRGSLHHASLKYRAPRDLLGSFRRGTAMVSGDAMHTFSPFLGQGGSASLEDAVVLARRLARAMAPGSRGAKGEIGEAFDGFVKERRLRVLGLSVETCLSELRMGTETSAVKKFVFGVVLKCFFGDPLGHARYDCGPL